MRSALKKLKNIGLSDGLSCNRKGEGDLKVRLIDAEALEKAMSDSNFYGDGRAAATHYADCVRNAQTVEAEFIEHSRWVSLNSSSHKFCESCGVGFNILFYERSDYRFCPYCGAKMDRGGENG